MFHSLVECMNAQWYFSSITNDAFGPLTADTVDNIIEMLDSVNDQVLKIALYYRAVLRTMENN